MKLRAHRFLVSLFAVAVAVGLALATEAVAQTDPLASCNDGAARRAIVEFVHATTDQSSPKFVPPAERIATFDQDGTLWVEHPIYTQVVYCLDRVPAVPNWEAGASGGGASFAVLTMSPQEAQAYLPTMTNLGQR